MKHVTIFGPTLVRAGEGQAVRYPYENPLLVSNREAQRLDEAGVLVGAPDDADGDDPVEDPPSLPDSSAED